MSYVRPTKRLTAIISVGIVAFTVVLVVTTLYISFTLAQDAGVKALQKHIEENHK
jgi:hypothetical protein